MMCRRHPDTTAGDDTPMCIAIPRDWETIMFLFGDLARTTQLFHTSDIAELMAEPPVAGCGRRQARETPAIARLVSEIGEREIAQPAVGAAARSPERTQRREQAAA